MQHGVGVLQVLRCGPDVPANSKHLSSFCQAELLPLLTESGKKARAGSERVQRTGFVRETRPKGGPDSLC